MADAAEEAEGGGTVASTLLSSQTQLKANQVYRVEPQRQDLVVRVFWITASEVCDLDLSCALIDADGSLIETVDFNDTISNCGSVEWISEEDKAPAGNDTGALNFEEIAIDLKRLDNRVQALVLWVTSFKTPFVESLVSRISFEVNHFQFADCGRRASGGHGHSGWSSRTVKSKTRLCSSRAKIDDDFSNAIMLVKLFADGCSGSSGGCAGSFRVPPASTVPGAPRRWTVHSMMNLTSINHRDENRKAIQQSVEDVFPWLQQQALRKIPNVPALCGHLSSKAMPRLKPFFDTVEPGHSDEGLMRPKFTMLLLKQLLKNEDLKEVLDDPEEVAHAVALIEELFAQIDINGDEIVDWEEFTSFCIEIGMTNTATSNTADLDEYSMEYVFDRNFVDHSRSGKASVRCMVDVPELRRIILVEDQSPLFRIYSRAGEFLHSHEVGLDEEREMHIHDIAYVPGHRLTVVAGSDHIMYLMAEQLSSSGQHRGYYSRDKIILRTLQSKLAWCPIAEMLLSIDTSDNMNIWDLEDLDTSGRMRQIPQSTCRPHRDVIMDILFIKDRGLFATCSLDRKILLWGLDNMKVRAELTGHTLGVRKMAYAHNTLVSVGFEYEAITWDVTSKQQLVKLRGHRAPINNVQILFVNFDHSLKAITCDDSGEFRLWELMGKAATSSCLHVFRGHFTDPNCPTSCFVTPFEPDHTIHEFSDMLVGGTKLYRLVPVKKMKQFAPVLCAEFNSASAHILCGIGNRVHLWDIRTGRYLRKFEIHHDDKCDACSLCLETPRQRRLFVGVESGMIFTINYVTGESLSQEHVHASDVTNMIFCEKTKCIISTGADGVIALSRQDHAELAVLRTVNHAHEGPILSCAYSYPMSIILTGGADSNLCVWDFQSLQRRSCTKGHSKGVMSLAVDQSRPIVLSLDGSNQLFMWSVDHAQGTHELNVLAKLGMYSVGNVWPAITSMSVVWEVKGKKAAGDGDVGGSSDPLAEPLLDPPAAESTPRTFLTGTGAEQSGGPAWNPMVAAGTENGAMVIWECGAVFEQQPQLMEPLPTSQWVPNGKVFKPYLRVQRDMRKYEKAANNLKEIARRSSLAQGQIPESDLTELQKFTGSDCTVQPASPSTRGASMGGRRRTSMIVKDLIQPSIKHTHTKIFEAHLDFVNKNFFFEFGSHTHMMTSSLDGYMKIWSSVDHKLLGTIRLPNVENDVLSEELRHSVWGVKADTVDVTEAHRALADKVMLSQMALNPSQRRRSSFGLGTPMPRARGSHGRGTRPRTSSSGSDNAIELSEEDLLFYKSVANDRQAKRTTFDTTVGRRGGNRTPARCRQDVLRQVRGGVDPNEGGPLGLNSERSATTGAALRRALTAGSLSGGGPHNVLPPAFSDNSIRLGMKDGLFDSECSFQLGKINRFTERRDAYDRAFPEIKPVRSIYEYQQRYNVGGTGRVRLSAADRPKDFCRQAAADHEIKVEDLVSDVHTAPQRVTVRDGAICFVANQSNDAVPIQTGGQAAQLAAIAGRLAEKSGRAAQFEQDEIDKRKAMEKAQHMRRLRMRKRMPWNRKGDGHRNREDEPIMIGVNDLRRGCFAPHYTLAEVLNFRATFNSVDVDMSGKLDMNEWLTFLTRMDQKMTPTEAQVIFVNVDADRSGTIGIAELIPLMFSKAQPEQHRLMHRLMLCENAKRDRKELDVKFEDVVRLYHVFKKSSTEDFPAHSLSFVMEALHFRPLSIELGTLTCEERGWTSFDYPQYLQVMSQLVGVRIPPEALEEARAGTASPGKSDKPETPAKSPAKSPGGSKRVSTSLAAPRHAPGRASTPMLPRK